MELFPEAELVYWIFKPTEDSVTSQLEDFTSKEFHIHPMHKPYGTSVFIENAERGPYTKFTKFPL